MTKWMGFALVATVMSGCLIVLVRRTETSVVERTGATVEHVAAAPQLHAKVQGREVVVLAHRARSCTRMSYTDTITTERVHAGVALAGVRAGRGSHRDRRGSCM